MDTRSKGILSSMKILITGGSGMVGKNLLENDKIITFDILSPSSKELNLLNFESTLNYIKEHQPDLVIHCAGRVGGIQANIKNPVQFLVENLDMGKNLVMAAKEAGVKKLLNLGSSCMYPRDAVNPLKEELILKGELEPTNEGYAIAKVTVARLCEYISRENDSFHYKTLIPCNLYGRHDKFDPKHSHMIPAVIRKIHEAKELNEDKVEIWGDGTARREFMLASDLSDFISLIIDKIETLEDYTNIGLGTDYSINEYYQEIAYVVGYKGEFFHNLDKPVGMKQKLVDISKMKNTGFDKTTSLRDGIQRTYEFFLENYGNEK